MGSIHEDIVGSNQVSVPIITSGFVESNNMSSSGFLFHNINKHSKYWIKWEVFIDHSYKYTTITLTLFVW